jgi:hypothetical protein
VPGAGSIVYPTGVIYTPNPGFTGTETFTISVNDGFNTAYTSITITVIPGPSLTLGAMPSICRGATTAQISFSDLTNVGSDTAVFSYTGGNQTWTVPPAVMSVRFDVKGASGGNDSHTATPNPGKGGRVEGNLTVSAGQVLNIMVGGAGSNGTTLGAPGGFNGGGNATFYFYGSAGGGGGASDIRIGGTALSDRVVVAGGGGGNGADGATAFAGGNGGGLVGGNAAANLGGSVATGGTQFSGGTGATFSSWAPGANGTFGNGGNGSTEGFSGGAGGGYYGGGGGMWSGGAGGSSYTSPTLASAVIHTQGQNTGHGEITVSYILPGTYNIVWDAPALSAGFANVTGAALPTTSPITINVPATAPPSFPGTYTGTLTISNGTCTSPTYPISVQIKQLPDVIVPGNQSLCDGAITTDINFTSSVITGSSISYNWVNDNPAIGLAAAGSLHIPAFTPVNGTAFPVVANITVTPVSNGCAGPSQTLQIVNNPIPVPSSTLTPPSICDNALFSYAPTSATPTTAFSWERAVISGLSNSAATGAGNVTEVLDNTSSNPVTATYVYTLTANGCSSTANVNVTVNPNPVLSTSLNPPSVCDNTVFNYVPMTATTAAVSTWSRSSVTGIANASSTGTGAITETLDNTTPFPVVVTYMNTLTIDGCSNTETISLTVNPKPELATPATPGPRCDSTLFNFIQSTSTPGTVFAWRRPAVSGIGNAAASGTGDINEYLVNTTPFPVTVIYTDTLKANGCLNVVSIPVTINPRPKLTSTLSPAGVCTNTLFNYAPSTLTPGTAFVWGRDTVRGISNVAVLDSGSVSESLNNFTDTAISVPYLYSLFANGCAHTQTVRVTIYPKPRLSNPVHTFDICDSTLFKFAPTSITPGAIFTWSRPYVSGINKVAAGGVDDPNEQLLNNTNVDVTTKYLYTIAANGCSNTDSIQVTVRPTPKLSSSVSPVVCSGAPFNFTLQSFTPGTTFKWSRAGVTGVIPATGNGIGNIGETLTTATSASVTASYLVTLTYEGCINKQFVNLKINPGPGVSAINVGTASACTNLQFANFGASTPPPAGVNYTWTATGASVWATGSNKQFALVNFTSPGTAVITLTATDGNACISSTTYTVNITAGSASVPTPVIYYNGQFIVQQTDVSNYQWGYDDAHTFDSSIFVGETHQNFAENAPDFANKLYWVMTTRNGCVQKSYYKAPAGVTSVNTIEADMKLYPNPAQNFVNVSINNEAEGNISVEVFNMLGQKLDIVPVDNHKAQVDVSKLPAGCYIIDCVSDGVKIASARFIKN